MNDISTPGQTPQGAKRLDPNLELNTIQSSMDKFLSAASVEAVYGAPISQGHRDPGRGGLEYRRVWSGCGKRWLP